MNEEALKEAKRLEVLVGRNIRAERVRKGMSSEVLAKGVGVTSSTIRRLETGTHSIRVRTLFVIAWVLNVPVSVLLNRQPETRSRARRLTPPESRSE